MEGGDEQASGYAHGFGDVVVVVAVAMIGLAKALGEDGYEIGCGFEERFVGVCA